MKNNFFIYICLIVITVLSLYCNPVEKDQIKLLITCEGTFTAYYNLNGNFTSINQDQIIDTSTVYYYENSFDDLNIIEVFATRDSCTDTLRLNIYRNGKRIKDAVLSAGTTETCSDNDLELDYEYNEENANTTTTTKSI